MPLAAPLAPPQYPPLPPCPTREEARESRPHPEEPRFSPLALEEGSFPCVVLLEPLFIPLEGDWNAQMLSRV